MVMKKEYFKGVKEQAVLALYSYGIISPPAGNVDGNMVKNSSLKPFNLTNATDDLDVELNSAAKP